MKALRASSLAVLVAAALAGVAVAASVPQRITANAVGRIHLGDSYSKLRAEHLIGKLRTGCELNGPQDRGAQLAAPLTGIVGLTLTSPRKVTSIAVTRGATARGVGIGATIAEIKAKFPKATISHAPETVFGFTSVQASASHGGPLEFAVDVKTKKTIEIGVPQIPTCD